MHELDIIAATGVLRRRDDLLLAGFTRRDVDQTLREGALVRVRRGWYCDGPLWRDLWPESQHRVHIAAVAADAAAPPIFSLTSAAALHGLPLHRLRVERVHTLEPAAGRHSGSAIGRHRSALADADVVAVDGHLCTSLERTVHDLLCVAGLEVAVAAADAALRSIAGPPRRYDEALAEGFRDAVGERIKANAGGRGVRAARDLVTLIDGRSELPLESVTKLQLRRLGFSQPGLQVEVPSPGGSFWMDLEIPGAGAFIECDGQGKYVDAALTAGRPLDGILLAEKHREDWVRGVTDKRVLRCASADVATPDALAARLRAFRIALPTTRKRLFLPRRPLLAGQ